MISNPNRISPPSHRRALCLSFVLLGCFAPLTAFCATPEPAVSSATKILNASDRPALTAPLVRAVYLVKPDILALTIDAQAVLPGLIEPYQAMDGDTVALGGYRIPLALAEASGVKPYVTPQMEASGQTNLFSVVMRGGQPFGHLLGPKKDHILLFDQLVGTALDETWAARVGSYVLSSTDDPSYKTSLSPVKVWRKTRPFRAAKLPNVGFPDKDYTHRHEIFLTLPAPLKSGSTYRLRFATEPGNPGTELAEVTLAFDDRRTTTEAIQINQNGYHPATAKTAFFSAWLGDGGGLDYPEVTAFELIDADGRTVFKGQPALRAKPGQVEFLQDAPNGDQRPIANSKASVYALDFSAFTKPGTYRVRVSGLGVSVPFVIAPDRWEHVFDVTLKGYYHQRASIELGPPYSSYSRPRNFHPDDGVVTYATDPARFYGTPNDKEGKQTEVFVRIQNSILLNKTVPNAIGGWHDAADFDRDIYNQRHLWPVNLMIDLYSQAPAFFERHTLNLPESGNTIPDILDEALWCTDLFLRIQQSDGGVPAAIESIEHPKYGETSWLNSVPTAATPPSPESNLHFAGTAARLAKVLAKYDPKKAATYRAAALSAIAWLEANPQAATIYLTKDSSVRGLKNFAYAALYDLTGEKRWQTAFAATLPPVIGRIEDEGGGLFIYATTAQPRDTALLQTARSLLLAHADQLLARQAKTATDSLIQTDFARTLSHGFQPVSLAYAAFLTGDRRYVEAIAKAAHYQLGANPMNISYIKGIGQRQVRPHHKDGPNRGLDVPDGIPVYGTPTNRSIVTRYSDPVRRAGVYPAIEDWPGTECYFDEISPNISEYTVFEPMANSLFGYGTLLLFTAPGAVAVKSDAK